jgi:hypothetical protein
LSLSGTPVVFGTTTPTVGGTALPSVPKRVEYLPAARSAKVKPKRAFQSETLSKRQLDD